MVMAIRLPASLTEVCDEKNAKLRGVPVKVRSVGVSGLLTVMLAGENV